MEQKYDYGMIGLGTMGRNLVLNMGDHGYSVAGFDKDKTKADELQKEAEHRKIIGTSTLEDFIGALNTPRVIMLLVPAGKPVDAVIAELKPLLSKDDLLIDCGNSHFSDTDNRIASLAKDNIHFMGVGVSGGEAGARFGPSIMPGGDKEAYKRVAAMFEAVSAKVDGQPCSAWMGNGSAGHYVKMVHNGIEYGLMQLIAEAYHMMKECAGMRNEELREVFGKWNEGPLKSFLIEITEVNLAQKDNLSANSLVDMILDRAKQNGTGQWASQSAMDLYVSISAIDAAVSARDLSAIKDERVKAEKILSWHNVNFKGEKNELVDWLEGALTFSFIVAYTQGMALMQKASEKYGYELNLSEIATIWRGGCIIRATLLEDIRAAYTTDTKLPNLMISKEIAHKVLASQDATRQAIKTATETGIPVPAMMASLAYYDSYRRGWLPANLIQAQRDFFGAHTYERTDREGTFHTQWNQKQN